MQSKITLFDALSFCLQERAGFSGSTTIEAAVIELGLDFANALVVKTEQIEKDYNKRINDYINQTTLPRAKTALNSHNNNQE